MNKQNKIKKRKEFNYIFNNGKAFFSNTLTLVYTTSKLNKFKVGFSASKKIGNSVVRNRARRRMREVVRLHENNLSKNYNYIFIATPKIDMADYKDIEKDFIYVMKKSGLFVES